MNTEKINEEREIGFKGWWHRNKKTVYIVGGIIIIVGIGCVLYIKFDTIKGLFTVIKPDATIEKKSQVAAKIETAVADILPEKPESIKKIINGGDAFDVSAHIRNLPLGWKASQEKIMQAAERGITLMEKQTLVNPYTKNTA